MNLIEQLGGYEEAKELLRISMIKGDYDGGVLKKTLLEYRRQHNIFEINDLIVLDNTRKYCALLPDDIMTYEGMFYTDARVGRGGSFFVVSFTIIRHATDAEIKAGKRLEVNDVST